MKNNIKNGIEEYYNNINNNSRYKSWEHCYSAFYNAIKNRDKSEEKIDYLCLHLAFYLASWGMYRGSSFLLEKDYTIHKEPIKKILDAKYSILSGMQCSSLLSNIDLLFDLAKELEDEYEKVRSEIKGCVNNNVSETLITKVLLGTLGCVPAYDRFFKEGLKKFKMKNLSFNKKSIEELCQYYSKYDKELEKKRKIMNIGKIKYPQMKLVDMGFWMAGKNNY